MSYRYEAIDTGLDTDLDTDDPRCTNTVPDTGSGPDTSDEEVGVNEAEKEKGSGGCSCTQGTTAPG
jgi:hypothetical protein